MRTMAKKCGIYAALAAVLLITVALVIGCPASPGISGSESTSVRLRFNDEIAARTIVPGVTEFDDFEVFEVTFTGTGFTSGTDYIFIGANAITKANIGNPIVVGPGTFNLTVNAYIDPTVAPNTPIDAAVTLTGVRLIANTDNEIGPVILRPVFRSGDTGTFAWNITNNITRTITSAEMALDPIGVGTAPAGSPYDLEGGSAPNDWVGSVIVDTGYYYVDFEIIVNGETRSFKHVLHIYDGLTSTFTYTFTDDYFAITQVLTTDWDYGEDIPLELELDGSPLLGKVTVDLYDPATTAVVQVVNVEDENGDDMYDTIEWYYNGALITTNVSHTDFANDTFTVDVANPPFNEEGTHFITVVAIKGVIPSSEIFDVEVVNTAP
jgi:hypothetical protein